MEAVKTISPRAEQLTSQYLLGYVKGYIFYWTIILIALLLMVFIFWLLFFLPGQINIPFDFPSALFVIIPFLLGLAPIFAVYLALREDIHTGTPLRRKIVVRLYNGGITYCESRKR